MIAFILEFLLVAVGGSIFLFLALGTLVDIRLVPNLIRLIFSKGGKS
jgi:hypothetical protein